MSGEGSGVNPKELIQQDGENVGNIADKELAQIGAEAENAMRDKTIAEGGDEFDAQMWGEVAGSEVTLHEVAKRAGEKPVNVLLDDRYPKAQDEFKAEEMLRKQERSDEAKKAINANAEKLEKKLLEDTE